MGWVRSERVANVLDSEPPSLRTHAHQNDGPGHFRALEIELDALVGFLNLEDIRRRTVECCGLSLGFLHGANAE